jgi:hypothetical protein
LNFSIPSSDPTLFQKANETAKRFASKHINEDTIGIVFLGGIARNYFDKYSDIDIAIFKDIDSEKVDIAYHTIDGFEIQTFISGYNNELSIKWDMSKRWAYSNNIVFYEKENQIGNLLKQKVSLTKDERNWMMISGITLSEWYCNRLLDLWINRGDILNAHYLINEGINQYFCALFALNNELVADFKWRIFCATQLPNKPNDFEEKLVSLMIMKENTIEDLNRRRQVFLNLWQWTVNKIEIEIGQKYDVFKNTV